MHIVFLFPNRLPEGQLTNIPSIMTRQIIDERFMQIALTEARKGLGLTSPNPAVGAVLVVGNRVIARGHHRGAGFPHAEIECLRNLDRPVSKDAALYVTLEPCSTTGRTPACTAEIIKAGLKTVAIGAIDPNPRHSGRAIKLLQNAGIETRSGILADECALMNETFNKWIVSGQPFVMAKCGMSLDGKLTRPPRETRWITSPRARKDAQQLRAQFDAILVGAETVRRDNPHLTVRGVRGARQPIRVVMTRSGNFSRHARVFTDRFAKKTIIYQNKSLDFVLRDLGRRNITSLIIEGGGDILSQALEKRRIDKIQIYLGPVITGGPVLAFGGRGAESTLHGVRLQPVSFQKLGQDVCVIGYPNYPRSETE